MLKSRAMNDGISTLTTEQSAAPDISAITALTKAAGDPLRMQVLKVLQQNAYGVLELSQIFAISQAISRGSGKAHAGLGSWSCPALAILLPSSPQLARR